jgi:hypothetical protein
VNAIVVGEIECFGLTDRTPLLWIAYTPCMQVELTDGEAAALTEELHDIVESSHPATLSRSSTGARPDRDLFGALHQLAVPRNSL